LRPVELVGDGCAYLPSYAQALRDAAAVLSRRVGLGLPAAVVVGLARDLRALLADRQANLARPPPRAPGGGSAAAGRGFGRYSPTLAAGTPCRRAPLRA
jgi:hypothetical protein